MKYLQQVKEVSLCLYSALLKLPLEYCVQFWGTQYKKDEDIIDTAQWRPNIMMKGLKQLYYEKRLRELGVLILHKRRLTGDLLNVYKFLKKGCKGNGTRLFSVVPSASARGNKHKLKHRRFCSEHQEVLLYCVGDLRTGTGCPERKQSLFPEDLLKAEGDGAGHPALSSSVWADMLDQMDTEALFKLSYSVIFCWTSHNVFKGTPLDISFEIVGFSTKSVWNCYGFHILWWKHQGWRS